jgi:sirohydrochlorin ferrochelatase
MKKALILVAHGSRHADADSTIRSITAGVRKRSGFDIVLHAFLQHSRPAPEEALEQCVAEGATSIVIIPFFLQPGGHVLRDIPALVEKARRRYPTVAIQMTDLVGAHPLLETIVIELAQRRCLE